MRSVWFVIKLCHLLLLQLLLQLLLLWFIAGKSNVFIFISKFLSHATYVVVFVHGICIALDIFYVSVVMRAGFIPTNTVLQYRTMIPKNYFITWRLYLHKIDTYICTSADPISAGNVLLQRGPNCLTPTNNDQYRANVSDHVQQLFSFSRGDWRGHWCLRFRCHEHASRSITHQLGDCLFGLMG